MYAEVILPLDLRERYHYRLSASLRLRGRGLVGCRAVVSFGSKRFYTGIIRSVEASLPLGLAENKLKSIDEILDEEPIVSEQMIEQWAWVAEYYCCSLGSVLRTAMPRALLPESSTVVYACEDFEAQTPLSEQEYLFLDQLHQEPKRSLSLKALQQRLGRADLSRLCTRLTEIGAIYTEEAVRSSYKVRRQRVLRLSEEWMDEEKHDALLSTLSRAPKQQALMAELLGLFAERGWTSPLPRREVQASEPSRGALITALIKRGCLITEEEEISRLDAASTPLAIRPNEELLPPPKLDKAVTLIYAHEVEYKEQLIASLVVQCLERGEQALLLSPSAYGGPSAARFISRLEAACSLHRVYHYHTMVSEEVRVEVYLRLARETEPSLVVGNRSALFLPLSRLGLIIVDEEHEYLYKQQHVAPRFHARDVSVWLGVRRACPVVLTSETPSAEVLFNTLRGKYGLIHTPRSSLDDGQSRCSIELIDLSAERDKRSMRYGQIISRRMQCEVNEQLSKGQRSLLLQNRKGYAPHIVCAQCGERIRCHSCDVSMHYYQSLGRLSCSYCGYSRVLPTSCPSCSATTVETSYGSQPALRLVGYGSERVEEEACTLWGREHILRIDSVSLQSAKHIREISDQIASGEVDIVIGTQLIKGQPIWDNLGLIAIVQLETILGFPDFRADERAFQLLYQLRMRAVSARSGMDEPMRMLIQTTNPLNPFIESLRHEAYDDFIKSILSERQLLGFPPFTRLTYIHLHSFDETLVEAAGITLVCLLRGLLEHTEVFEAQRPYVGRIDGQYLRRIMLRRPYQVSYRQEREAMLEAEAMLRRQYPELSRVRIDYDVDPL